MLWNSSSPRKPSTPWSALAPQNFLAQLAERDLVFADVPEELEQQRRRIAHSYDQVQDKIFKLNPRDQAKEIEDLLNQLRELRRSRDVVTKRIIRASPRLGALRYPKPLDFAAAQKTMAPGTTALSYSAGEKSTVIFVLASKGDLRVETLPIGEKDLRNQIREWNGLILKALAGEETGALRNLRLRGKSLYKTLIEPVADAVAESQRLLIIPDGPLHVLPWGALIRETESAGRNVPDRMETPPHLHFCDRLQ